VPKNVAGPKLLSPVSHLWGRRGCRKNVIRIKKGDKKQGKLQTRCKYRNTNKDDYIRGAKGRQRSWKIRPSLCRRRSTSAPPGQQIPAGGKGLHKVAGESKEGEKGGGETYPTKTNC